MDGAAKALAVPAPMSAGVRFNKRVLLADASADAAFYGVSAIGTCIS